jgi:2-keto-4-pentenoate hydratase
MTSISDSLGTRRPAQLQAAQISDAARLLIDARAARRPVDAPFAIPTADDAYAIQDAVAASLGPIGAWKVGAKGPQAQPTCAPILAGLVRPSPASIPASTLGMIGIEAEIAFSLARDIAPGDRPLGNDDLASVIAGAHPAIEVVDTRVANWRKADRLWLLADNQMNAALVAGEAVADWRHRDFTKQPVALKVDGKATVEAIGGNAAGDPRRLLLWLIDHCCGNGIALRAGTLITSGSCTGMTFVQPSARVVAEFLGFGAASVVFPA